MVKFLPDDYNFHDESIFIMLTIQMFMSIKVMIMLIHSNFFSNCLRLSHCLDYSMRGNVN